MHACKAKFQDTLDFLQNLDRNGVYIHRDYKVCMRRAPEQADAEFGHRGPHNDVWGFATCLLHLATAQQPYQDLTLVQMLTAMTRGRPPAVPPTLPAWLQDLLKQCLSFDIPARPSVLQLLQVKIGPKATKFAGACFCSTRCHTMTASCTCPSQCHGLVYGPFLQPQPQLTLLPKRTRLYSLVAAKKVSH